MEIVAASLALEKEIKNLADELKNKINSLSITFSGIASLLENLFRLRRIASKQAKRKQCPARGR